MNDFLTKIKELCNSTVVYWILVGVTVFGVCYGADYLKNRYNSSASATAATLAEQIKSAGEHQRAISSEVSEAETRASDVSNRIEKSQAGIRNAQDSAGNIEAAIEEQRRIIGECKSLLGEILEGNEEQAGDS